MPNKIELKVGIFIVVTTILIATSIGFVAYKKGVFAEIYTYTLSSKSGDGLTEGMPVVFSGFKIGQVHSLELSDNSNVLIKIKIPKKHVKWLRTKSTFIVEKPVIGSPRIVIATTDLSSPQLPTQGVYEVGMADDINETVKKVQPIIAAVNEITANVSKITGTLADKKSILEMAVSDKESVASVHGALKKTEDISKQVDTLLKRVDTMAQKTDDSLYGKDGLMVSVSGILKDLLVKLEKLDVTLDNVNKISSDATGATKDIQVLRSEIDATVSSIGKVVNEIDKKIPFKKEPEIKLP
ncbi:MAG: MlaD family protein [Smithellaceae bacterium]|nr:MlaD family protein [Smithellaceae bacterium]